MNTTPHSAPAKHLTAADLEPLLFATTEAAPDATAAVPQYVTLHLRDCPACAAELDSLRATLHGFRQSATGIAAAQLSSARAASNAPASIRAAAIASTGRPARMQWALVAAAACLATAIAVPLAHREGTNPSAAPAPVIANSNRQPAAISDDALLAGVQQDLEASVPSPLLPLANNSSSRASSTSVR